MALDLEDLDVAPGSPQLPDWIGWLTRLRRWQSIAADAGSPDPALGFLTRLGALVNALRSIERGYPWRSIQEDFVYAETGKAPR